MVRSITYAVTLHTQLPSPCAKSGWSGIPAGRYLTNNLSSSLQSTSHHFLDLVRNVGKNQNASPCFVDIETWGNSVYAASQSMPTVALPLPVLNPESWHHWNRRVGSSISIKRRGRVLPDSHFIGSSSELTSNICTTKIVLPVGIDSDFFIGCIRVCNSILIHVLAQFFFKHFDLLLYVSTFYPIGLDKLLQVTLSYNEALKVQSI